MNWQAKLLNLLPLLPAFLLAFSVHESAHGLAALWLGDPSAKKQGRISLYPPRHFDLFGSLILPLLSLPLLQVFYGYGRPAPVDPGRLRRPKPDFSLVALAGPLSNFVLALASAGLGRLLMPWASVLGPLLVVCEASVELNLILGAISLLPLPGFDGMKALYFALPDEWCWRLNRAERWGLLYLAALSAFGGLAWLATFSDFSVHLIGRIAGFPQ